MKREKHDYSHAFKAKVGMEALKDRNTIGDLALKYNAPAYSILKWKKDAMYSLPDASRYSSENKKNNPYLDRLNSKIDKLEKDRSLYKTNIEKFGL